MVFGVEVRDTVLPIEHADRDPEEDGYHRHGSRSPSIILVGLRAASAAAQRPGLLVDELEVLNNDVPSP